MRQKGDTKQVPFAGSKSNVHNHIKFIRLGDMAPRICACLTCYVGGDVGCDVIHVFILLNT